MNPKRRPGLIKGDPIDPPRGAVALHPLITANMMPAWDVYFVLARTSGAVKIGYAKNAWQRLANLQTGSAEELSLLGIIPTYLPTQLEGDLHAHFAEHHIRGEWFTVTHEMLAYIEKYGRDGFEAAGVEVMEVGK